MSSPPADKVLPKGVAAIIHDLVEFSPVHDLFRTHLQLWRQENEQIVAHRRELESELATYWRDKPHAPDPDRDGHLPARRIYSPDRTKSGLFVIPTELDRELKQYFGDPIDDQYSNPIHYHLLRSLDDEQDFSTTESFVLLAELHDAAYQSSPIGYAIDHIASVAEAADILKQGMSQVAVQNLATLVQRVLDLIEAQADSKSKNRTGKTLQQIIQRSREKLADLVIRSRPQQAIPARMTPDETLVSADQLGVFAGVGEKVIRTALTKAGCKPSIESTGKGNPHQWRYCDAIQSLKTVKSGKLRSCIWPDSASEVMRRIDSSKIPARK